MSESSAAVASTPDDASKAAPAAAAATAAPAAASSSPAASIVSCLDALGPVPSVDSVPALSQLAAQLHVLTAPLPTVHSQLALSSLEETVHTQLARMDEFSELLETLKKETQRASSDLMPLVTEKQAKLAPLFQQIHTFDKYATELERYVAYVESRTDQVEAILKKTTQMEQEYARTRDMPPAGRSSVAAELQQAEKAVSKLWTSLKNFGSKNAPTNAAPAAASSSASSSAAPTTLDLVDEWVPFEPSVSIDDYFASPPDAASTRASE